MAWKDINHELLNYKEQSKELSGKRLRCIEMKDLYPVPSGTMGTIINVDDVGTVHVKWDNGSTLGLVPNEDSYEIVK